MLKSKSIVYRYLYPIIILLFATYLFYLSIHFKKQLYELIIKTLEVWLYKVFPPLFTIYFISSIILSTNSIRIISFLSKPLRLLFKFNTQNGLILFLMSFVNGVPSIITLIDNYYQKRLITKEDYLILIKCSGNISPLFIFSLTDFKIIIYVYLSHILSNIILCFILTRTKSNYKENISNNFTNIKVNFFEQINIFPNIILVIALYMVSSNILIYSLNDILPSNLLVFMEVSNGCITIITNKMQLYLLPLLLSFNGFCIHLQLITLSKNFNYKLYFNYRLLSMFITFIIYLLFNTIFI